MNDEVKRPTWCGGAVLRIDEVTYRAMEREGTRWATRSDAFKTSIDPDGKVLARVACESEAAPQSTLCVGCYQREANWRRVLRDIAKNKGDR